MPGLEQIDWAHLDNQGLHAAVSAIVRVHTALQSQSNGLMGTEAQQVLTLQGNLNQALEESSQWKQFAWNFHQSLETLKADLAAQAEADSDTDTISPSDSACQTGQAASPGNGSKEAKEKRKADLK